MEILVLIGAVICLIPLILLFSISGKLTTIREELRALADLAEHQAGIQVKRPGRLIASARIVAPSPAPPEK